MTQPIHVTIWVPIIVALIGFLGILLAAFITKYKVQKPFFTTMQNTYQGIIDDQNATIVNLRQERDLDRKDLYKMKDHIQILILETDKIKTQRKKEGCKRSGCNNRIPI